MRPVTEESLTVITIKKTELLRLAVYVTLEIWLMHCEKIKTGKMPSLSSMKTVLCSFWVNSRFAIDAAGQWNRSWVYACGHLGGRMCSPSCSRTDKPAATRPRKPAVGIGI